MILAPQFLSIVLEESSLRNAQAWVLWKDNHAFFLAMLKRLPLGAQGKGADTLQHSLNNWAECRARLEGSRYHHLRSFHYPGEWLNKAPNVQSVSLWPTKHQTNAGLEASHSNVLCYLNHQIRLLTTSIWSHVKLFWNSKSTKRKTQW